MQITHFAIQALLATRKQIAIIFSIDDVHDVRPDLTDDQAWHLLQEVERHHDAEFGVNWELLEHVALRLFGAAPESSDE